MTRKYNVVFKWTGKEEVRDEFPDLYITHWDGSYMESRTWPYMKQENINRYNKNERPKRIPAEVDVVGNELKKLWKENPQAKGLKHYIAHWHKMRSSIYLRLGMHKKSFKEAMKGLRYHPLNWKLYAYALWAVVKG